MRLVKSFMLTILLLGTSLTLSAQTNITQAFADGNMIQIENFLGNQIEINIQNN